MKFCDFKNWLYLLENEETKNQIKTLIDGQQLVLFFKKDKEIYGAGEDGRVVFARIKNPDDDTSADEASFMAINLKRALQGEKVHSVFGKEDIKKIKVLEREKVEDILDSAAGNKVGKLEPEPSDTEEPQGMVQMQDEHTTFEQYLRFRS